MPVDGMDNAVEDLFIKTTSAEMSPGSLPGKCG